MAHHQSPLFHYERHPDDELGRRLIASSDIQEGRLVFVERPVVAMQTIGNMHDGVLVCNYCMAFCGSPEQALRVASDPSCLQEITTSSEKCVPVNGDNSDLKNNFFGNIHALHCCRHNCGHIYCSLECQQDDWEWGGHRELCTGTIPESDESTTNRQNSGLAIENEDKNDNGLSEIVPYNDTDSQMDPLLKFKIHAMETNEIFFIVATWLVRILKNDLPYNDDDNMNTHPYTDFQMNIWWDVKAEEDATLKITQRDDENVDEGENEGKGDSLADVLKQLCQEAHKYLSQTLKSRLPSTQSSPWLTTIGIARLIGSLEQNCLGIRRKHVLQRDIMENTALRHESHSELVQCLMGAGMLGNRESEFDDDSSCGCGDDGIISTDIDTNANTNDSDDVKIHGDSAENTGPSTIDTAVVVGADESVHEDEQSEYLPDDIASILADLNLDQTNKCVYDEWDEVIRPLDGVSHYSIATKMNHSCEPNVVLVYMTRGWGRDHPLVAYIVAIRDISPGEELTISYIASEDSYEKRQASLANYGFVCRCSKCEREKDTFVEEYPNAEVDYADEEDLFGEDDDNDEDENDLFGDDEDDLFGDDEDQNGQGDDELGRLTRSECDENQDVENDLLSGEQKLSNIVQRLDTALNKLKHIAIPLTCLAPVSNYVVKQISSLLQDFQSGVGLKHDKHIITSLLEQHMNAVKGRDFASCRTVGSKLERFLYNHLESKGSWPTVLHRASYWCASITSSIGYAHEGSFLVSMKYLDKAIILGQDRNTIKSYFDYVEMYASQMAAAPCPTAIKCKVSDFQCTKLRELVSTRALPKQIQFPVSKVATNGDSDKIYIQAACNRSESLVIRGLASKWLAVNKWRNVDSLARKFGHRLIPIEVGSMNNGMKEAVVPFRHFVGKYLSASSKKDCWSIDDAVASANDSIAYLAQHPLLDQIPALCRDIDMNPCGVQPSNINIWMGTGGTRTPLHFDTYDNLLVQLVGAKYVRLYKKESSPQLYISKDKNYGGQGNMSELDCEREDFEKHPLSKDCSYTEVLLFPGDCLFIPSREWHYVRSLSTSVSVNYWF